MRSSTTLLTVGLLSIALVAQLPGAAALTGPYAGVVTEGDSNSHHYDNNPTKADCVQIVRTYTVVLTEAPADAVLELSAGGKTARTDPGATASVSFLANYCTSFGITVTGVSVDTLAAYEVTVIAGAASPIGGGAWS